MGIAIGLYAFRFLGTEFLPELNEGSIWVRATLPYSISLDTSMAKAEQMRAIMIKFPQVRRIMSQTGRPDDGTDVAGFYNNEFRRLALSAGRMGTQDNEGRADRHNG